MAMPNKMIMKKIYCILSLSLISLAGFAQEDMMKLLDDSVTNSGKPKKEFTTATFKGTRLINFHTVETVGKRSLDFRISHRFGDFNTGANNAFGLDGPASIHIGFDYSYDGRLMFGIGRCSSEKKLDGLIKYRLIRQTTDNSMPLSVTLVSAMYCTTLKGLAKYSYELNRLSYSHQVIIGRKFSERLSLEMAPIFIHYNIVDSLSDLNDMFAIQFSGRYKFRKRAAITFEYGLRVSKYTNQKYYDSAGIGVDLETGGHVFQMHFVNSFGILEDQFIPHTTSNWMRGGIKLGFNISRVFRL
jgi:hypothetical protein